ncbi:MAG: SUMF1/EgtB/PvdO family nonheme iron enzyme [Sediminicola sp.]
MKISFQNYASTIFCALIFFVVISCKTPSASIKRTTEPSPSVAENEIYVDTVPFTDVKFKMVLVPAGRFFMGSPSSELGRKEDEGPRRQVEIDSFWMGTYEVTWDLFELFFKENKNLFQNIDREKRSEIDAITRPSPPYEDPSFGMGTDGFPAVSMSAYSALVFCKWLSKVTGRFYRLPTEAEWEYAARAGSEGLFYFGNDIGKLGDYAVFYGNSNNHYAPVGSKIPNSWGLYDMLGNVAEWTLDGYSEKAYETTGAENPWVVPTQIHPRTIRGGSWDDDPEQLRSAARMSSSLALQKSDPQVPKSFWWFTDSNFVGFRLVSPNEQPTSEQQERFWQTVLDE